jgi:hypothetical protein
VLFAKTLPVVNICPSSLGVLYRRRLYRNFLIQYRSNIDIIGSMMVKNGIDLVAWSFSAPVRYPAIDHCTIATFCSHASGTLDIGCFDT